MRFALLFVALLAALFLYGCSDDDYGQDLGNHDMTVDVSSGTD